MFKPKAEEVRNYAFSIGFKLDGNHFCDFYESKGWMVGRSPMKDWKAAVRTWKRNAPQESMVGQNYDYSKFEQRKKQLEELKEREWARRQGEAA